MRLVELPDPEPTPDDEAWVAEVLAEVEATEPAAVSLLRELLERARRGEVLSVALAAETTDGCVASAYAFGETGNLYTLIGAVAELERRLLAHGDQADED